MVVLACKAYVCVCVCGQLSRVLWIVDTGQCVPRTINLQSGAATAVVCFGARASWSAGVTQDVGVMMTQGRNHQSVAYFSVLT